jgi:hypothetical protein
MPGPAGSENGMNMQRHCNIVLWKPRGSGQGDQFVQSRVKPQGWSARRRSYHLKPRLEMGNVLPIYRRRDLALACVGDGRFPCHALACRGPVGWRGCGETSTSLLARVTPPAVSLRRVYGGRRRANKRRRKPKLF